MVLRRTYHMLKSIKAAFWLPILLVFIVVPLSTYQMYTITDIYIAENHFIKIIQFIIPILSVIWLCFTTINYLHSKGKELIWIHDIWTNNALNYSLLILGIYTVIIFIFMYFASYFFYNMFIEFIRLFALILFFYSFSYMFIFTFKSTGISIIAIAMLYLFMLVVPAEYFRKIIIFTPSEPASVGLIIYKYLPVSFISICFFAIGTFFSRKFSS